MEINVQLHAPAVLTKRKNACLCRKSNSGRSARSLPVKLYFRQYVLSLLSGGTKVALTISEIKETPKNLKDALCFIRNID
jgi:hypothetical protein